MNCCYVCGKKLGRNLFGHRIIRCERCRPGSLRWAAWYERLPASKRTEAGELLYHHAIRKGTT